MKLFNYIYSRLFENRPFYYSWEQRAFEGNQERTHEHSREHRGI
jgi:hypothetical protein